MVTLTGGHRVPVEAVALASDLEAASLEAPDREDSRPALRAEGGLLYVYPASLLTEAMKARIRPLKYHLLGLVGYSAHP
jgi:hypothetical protein